MSRAANTIVAEIKTLYGRRREEKLVIQKDMAVLRDEHGWTVRQIADETGIPKSTVDQWLQAYDEGLSEVGQVSRLTPESKQDASDRAVARRVIGQAPMEEIERMIDELPQERQRQVAAAAGHAWHKARVEHDERERNLTPAQRKEREATGSMIKDMGTKMTSGFEAMSIVAHLEEATDKLRALNEAHAVTPELGRSIGKALAAFEEEIQVALAIAQLERGPGGLIEEAM